MIDLRFVRFRSHLIQAVRRYFDGAGFEEIIVPVLAEALPLEPTIFSFATQWQTNQGDKTLYMAISPENAMKKMLAAGFQECYSIGKCFRNLEASGSRHNPEFLMLEWYRVASDYRQIMRDTQSLVQYAIAELKEEIEDLWFDQPAHLTPPIQLGGSQDWPVLSLANLYTHKFGLSVEEIMDESVIRSLAQAQGYQVVGATWEQLFDQLLLNEIEPDLPSGPFFMIDFPSRLSPLCRPRAEQPLLAERFEFYVGSMEVGNGNTEHLNHQLVEQHFQREDQYRRQARLSSHPYDRDFLQALGQLEATGQSYAGMGLGIDRLAMVLSGAQSINQIEPLALVGKLT